MFQLSKLAFMKALFIITCLFASSLSAEEHQFVLGEGLSIKIVESAFISSEWNISYCPNSKRVCFINGLTPMGVDGNIPETYVSKLVATVNGLSYQLDTSNMFNAWGDRPLEHPGSIKYFSGVCQYQANCTFRGIFSDAAASFVVEWRINQGVPERTIMTSSQDVVSLFIDNIDPPVYD
ncbi:hypothetical protein ACFOEK_06825 [Litoribrevibacter euphylliae]|uniref:Uncharacterized protein n=1 Tax=Litoribrevibacter euphylliae TaxID=1834034 RepID=A0ABV7HDH5_9GAMM